MRTFTAAAAAAAILNANPSVAGETPINWDDIKPSHDLEYQSCSDGLECARLIVPLDWLEANQTKRDEQTIILALAKQPATVAIDDPKFGGTVIVNPGGPGDSGVLHIQRNGEYLQEMMDSENKHFEVLSFDPRGMANSFPISDCFSDEASRALTGAVQAGMGVPNSNSDASLALHKAYWEAIGMQCSQPGPHGYAIQDYMSTASVARDMLHMVDKLDVWKKKQLDTKSEQTAQKPLGSIETDKDEQEPRLLYYGTSYGTLLGNTFISMFPGRTGRMILDGVVVPEDYSDGDWCPNLEDTSKTINYFYETCFDAKDKCALYKASEKNWHQLRDRVEQKIADLDTNPVPFIADGVAPGIINSAVVRNRMMDPIYGPLDLFDGLAKTLLEVLNGNYTSLLKETGMTKRPDTCSKPDPSAYAWMGEANLAVRCGDGADLRDRSLDFWRDTYERCVKNSPEIGPGWFAVACGGWQSRPKFRFSGPFKSPVADLKNIEGRPSAPVLFLSSRLDPVTPLVSAHTASKNHPGSVVLMQDSVGHCTLLSSPSKCTREHVGRYLDTGELPEEGTVCEADCRPWEHCDHKRAQFPR